MASQRVKVKLLLSKQGEGTQLYNDCSTCYVELCEKVTRKLGTSSRFALNYEADGRRISLANQGDFEVWLVGSAPQTHEGPKLESYSTCADNGTPLRSWSACNSSWSCDISCQGACLMSWACPRNLNTCADPCALTVQVSFLSVFNSIVCHVWWAPQRPTCVRVQAPSHRRPLHLCHLFTRAAT